MPIGLSTAVIGAGVLGAGASLVGSSKAASAQTNAANQANATAQQQFNTTQSNLAPFINGGGLEMAQLQAFQPGNTPQYLTDPSQFSSNQNPMFSMTEDQLKQTPGYQFTLNQGLQNTQNSYAAKGLSSSGAALKGAAQYATGLADQTYQTQFNNYQQGFTNNLAQNNQNYQQTLGANTENFNQGLQGSQLEYNQLLGRAQLSANAAAGLGNIGQTTASQIGQNTIGAGNAQAASSIAQGNAVGGVGNSLLTSMLLGGNGVNAQSQSAFNNSLYAPYVTPVNNAFATGA